MKIIFINSSIYPLHPTPIINEIIHIHIHPFINQALSLYPIDGDVVGDIVGGFDPPHPLSSAGMFMMHQSSTHGLRLVPCIPVRESLKLKISSLHFW